MIEVEQKSDKSYQLNAEAQEIVKLGSHEANIFKKIPDTGMLQADLMVNLKKNKIKISAGIFSNYICL